MEAADLPRTALSRTQRLKVPSALMAMKDKAVDVVATVVVEEHEDGLLQTLAELISTPSLELLPFRGVSGTKRRDSPSTLQVLQEGAPSFQVPGIDGKDAGRHPHQAEMMLARMLFGRAGGAGQIYLPF
jgi:hypothetical protein